MVYKYETATGTVEIEVTEEWAEKLKALDRKEHANDKTESRRHLSLDTSEGSWLTCEDEKLKEFLYGKQKSNKERLYEALDMLKPEQRKVIDLFYFESKTQEEIASIIGIDQSCVSRRIQTAEKNLKKFFEKTA